MWGQAPLPAFPKMVLPPSPKSTQFKNNNALNIWSPKMSRLHGIESQEELLFKSDPNFWKSYVRPPP